MGRQTQIASPCREELAQQAAPQQGRMFPLFHLCVAETPNKVTEINLIKLQPKEQRERKREFSYGNERELDKCIQ